MKRVLGIDLGGASSKTTGYVLLVGENGPVLEEAGLVTPGASPKDSEKALLTLIDETGPDVVAIDAPLTLPPCLTCPSYCRGPGDLCELRAAQKMWNIGLNPVSQRECEHVVAERVKSAPLPTIQLGVITGRAVALARCLASRGRAPSVMERGEILEVYPRATLARLGAVDPRLAPRARLEDRAAYRQRVVDGFNDLVVGISPHSAELKVSHTLDALVAAYTGWLSPGGLEQPPPDFNIAAGWIWFPRLTAGTAGTADSRSSQALLSAAYGLRGTLRTHRQETTVRRASQAAPAMPFRLRGSWRFQHHGHGAARAPRPAACVGQRS
jgi:predicted nuclease with RNAse H fold